MIVYRDPDWFKTRVHNWAFTGLTWDNRDAILAFILASAGRYIGVTDYFGQTYDALIMNPANPITQETPDYMKRKDILNNITKKPGTYGAGYTWKVDLQRRPTT